MHEGRGFESEVASTTRLRKRKREGGGEVQRDKE